MADVHPISIPHKKRIGRFRVELILDQNAAAGFWIRIKRDTGWDAAALIWHAEERKMLLSQNDGASQAAIDYARVLGAGFALGMATAVGWSG